MGTEVKALREGKANLKDSYALVKDGEVFVHEMHISPYTFGNRENHDPLRVRKLLLHKGEIKRLYGKSRERGLALIPLKLYFKSGKVKMEIGVGRGKKLYDKRESLRDKDDRREMERGMRRKDKNAKRSADLQSAISRLKLNPQFHPSIHLTKTPSRPILRHSLYPLHYGGAKVSTGIWKL